MSCAPCLQVTAGPLTVFSRGRHFGYLAKVPSSCQRSLPVICKPPLADLVMTMNLNEPRHNHGHAFRFFNAREREGLVFAGRRGMLKAGLAGFAGLTLPNLLRARADAAAGHGPDGHRPEGNRGAKNGKSVILLWMAGGPSHIDTWDVKPERPYENRGPFSVIPTRLPGVNICEHLPKQAALLDRFTLIRSVDARNSNHEPNQVFQTGNLEAEPRISRNGDVNTPQSPR